ncbi:splicing factor ESS-2 family protein [Sporobolomyces koalae]|uniref:splicing factor ESS-2 family protein n=1 Tax=Sporobolomyces koalae TaxID=500713 RepID=UPI0031756C6D
MPRERSQPPTPYASTSTGPSREWDTPVLDSHAQSTSRRQHRATPSTRRSTTTEHRELVRSSEVYKPTYSKYKQEILSEEEYITHLSDIIKRDFFPQLYALDTRREIIQGLESHDEHIVGESVRRLRELCTPVATHSSTRRRHRANDTPGRTPLDSTYGADTPTAFDRTPLTSFSATPASHAPNRTFDPSSGGINTALSLDAFQSKYTSEDNSSFATLLARDNQARRDKTRWAWEAERRANEKQIRGRHARERLVDVTREMIESSGDGTVWMLEGQSGRPGERQVLVGSGTKVGDDDRGLIKGRDEKERLRITGGNQGDQKLILGVDDKGKGKQTALTVASRVDDKAKQYVDYDRPAVEEEEEARPLEKKQLQVDVETWPFRNRNSLMFPPDADTDPSDPPPPSSNPANPSTSTNGPVLPVGEPKGIRYHATRLMELETGEGSQSGGTPSPSRSRINAAISGTPYPVESSNTPRVNDFSFVSALPSPRANQLPPQALQELMTWGSIEATPITLRTHEVDASVGPFRIEDTSRREELAFKMARKAKRSLAETAASHGSATAASGSTSRGLALGGGNSTGLRRSVLDSVRSSTMTGRCEGISGNSTPRTGDHLSPAARSLLSKTKPGRALERGLSRNQQQQGSNAVEMGKYERQEEDRRRVERARKRAREVESQDRLKRERWTPSPAVSLGFDPDLEGQGFLPKHGKMA